jgi:excinuclease ABC subunit B
MDIPFQLTSQFQPSGDQPDAIKKLAAGVKAGMKGQVLLGVTGSGKNFYHGQHYQ